MTDFVRDLRKKHNIANTLLDEETFNAMSRLAELVGAAYFPNYQSYLRYEAIVEQKRQEYRKKIGEDK
jgi:hypothetical protein